MTFEDPDLIAETTETTVYRRTAREVMRLDRLGSAHPMRLSFLRILLRRMVDEKWRFDRPLFEMDARGVGRAVYRAIGPERCYSLVCFAHDLPAEMRSDRVIATAWDATSALFDGTPDSADLDRLAANVPVQEAGRVSNRELSLSRANRSVRLFDHVVDRLSRGLQPDVEQITGTGYLMRTTAVYGAGKFGAADRHAIVDRPEMLCPFQAEMLSVWLTRSFSVDIVEHLARIRGGDTAVRLSAVHRKALGVGNSTGLGMAPFLVRHPVLLNNWIMVREEALARVRSQTSISPQASAGFDAALIDAIENVRLWHSEHALQQEKLAALRSGLDLLAQHVRTVWDRTHERPWDALWRWSEAALPVEAQESLVSLMLEPHGDLVDDLAQYMAADESPATNLDGSMSVGELQTLICSRYDWALQPDYGNAAENARFWYVSEDKLEPRLGERFEEPGAEREQPLDTGRQVAALNEALQECPSDTPLARLLLQKPEHRSAVRRVQLSAHRPFAEIQDNLISADLMPIDMLRCKLAFFGATRFDPRSDRWVRINLFQGLPYPDEIGGR